MKNNTFHHIEILPITDEATYQKNCDLIENLMDMGEQPQPEIEASRLAYLDALATLVEAFENKNFALNKTELTLVQIIEQALEQLNLTKTDLAKLLGSNRVTELFNGKRDLSMAQVRLLHQELKIPTDLLIFSKRLAAA
ncbi:MAG: type II toxin-antitoxin system HigA family antitoxin [Saprospiraceae bacterium]